MFLSRWRAMFTFECLWNHHLVIFIITGVDTIPHLFFNFIIRSSKSSISSSFKLSYILFIFDSEIIRFRFFYFIFNVIFIKKFTFIFLHELGCCVTFKFSNTFLTSSEPSNFLISFLWSRRNISIRLDCKIILRELSFGV